MEKKDDFALLIKKNIDNNKDKFKKVHKNSSVLKDYKSICLEINKIISKKEQLEEYELKPLKLYLKYQNQNQNKAIENNNNEEMNIEINNKEEWDILYNYNIINECINSNKLKLYYDIIEENENNIINQTLDLKKIINYITDKMPKDYILNLFFQFFSINKDIAELFKTFFLNEIKKVKIDEIENNFTIKNEQLKEYINNLININENIEKKDSNNSIKLIKSLHTLRDIKNIINEDEDSFEKNNINNTDLNEEKINKIKEDIFETIDSSDNNLFLTSYKSNIDRDKVFDEKNLFKKFNRNEYYVGIETFKDKLSHDIIEANI